MKIKLFDITVVLFVVRFSDRLKKKIDNFADFDLKNC